MITSELWQGPHFTGGASASVVQFVQQDLFVGIKKIRTEACDGGGGSSHIVPIERFPKLYTGNG